MLNNCIAIVHLGKICGCLAWANTSEVLLGNCVTVCLCHLYASAAHKRTVDDGEQAASGEHGLHHPRSARTAEAGPGEAATGDDQAAGNGN